MKALLSVVAVVPVMIVLSGCFGSSTPEIQGYVEGTYVYISAEAAGMVVERPVIDGEAVEEGDLLARLDEPEQKEAVAEAEARVAQARAQLGDLLSGQRPEEISVIAAQLQEALSQLSLSEENFQRQVALRARGIVAQSVVDDARTQRDTNKASAEAIERQLAVAKLPARPDEIAAAERNVAAEEAALAQASIQLERRRLTAPATGRIEETFFEVGERVTAGQPVISLLPAANVKVRFFLPEEQLASVQIGDPIAVGCDGCPEGLTAEVDRIATEAEFTPPVLYSKDSRTKLVYLVEAKPLGAAVDLKPGQPVDVTLEIAP